MPTLKACYNTEEYFGNTTKSTESTEAEHQRKINRKAMVRN